VFEELIPDIQEPARALFLAAGQAGLHPRVTSTVRGRTEQARLYRRYLSGLAKYPVAPPGTSAHEFGFAFDMVCTPLDALSDVGYTWVSWGGVWHQADEVHFEYPGFVAPAPAASSSADPYLVASQVASRSPILSLLEPWQLMLYNSVPWIRGLINPLWTIDQLNAFFAGL
jgi:hypothetical protein